MAQEMELLELTSFQHHGLLSDHFQYILALDIGTIYSGYAFANKDDIDLEKGQLDIECSQVWNSGKPNFLSLKTATCVLLDRNETLVAFGFEAENKYCQLVREKRDGEYYYFRRFKMELYNKKITPDFCLTEIGGKQLLAKYVFGQCILALKQKFFEVMNNRNILLDTNDVRYVVTVPAIWSDAAKQFMRQAANEAGIKNEHLLIALEPEAASIYSQFIRTKETRDLKLTVSKVGTRYLVADLGGGTADISAHEKLPNGYLKEIHRCRGDDCGGNSVNEALLTEISKNFGGPVLHEIRNVHPSVFYDVHREFEAAKKTVDGRQDSDLSMRLPLQFLNVLVKNRTDENLLEMIEVGPHGAGVTVQYDTIYIKQSMVIKKLFKPTTDRIISLLSDVINEGEAGGETIDKILLVGGFSESKYIQNSIRDYFPNKLVIIPASSELCVLKGAVLFGFSPRLISHRVMRFTYGVESCYRFDKAQHEDRRKKYVNGIVYCSHIFYTFVEIGSVVEIDTKVTKRLKTVYPCQRAVSFPVFTSQTSSPKYVDDPGCKEIGRLTVEITNPTEEERSFEVSLVFGNTEIQINAIDAVTKEHHKASIDFVLY